MGVVGNEGKHVFTFRDKPHGHQPCAPFGEGRLVGQSYAAYQPCAFCCWKNRGGRKRAWGNRGLSAAVPKTTGFRPYGNKSSGMVAALHDKQQQQQQREKSQREQIWVFRQPALVWSGNSAGVGDRYGHHGGVFIGMNYEYVFVDRNDYFDRIILRFIICGQGGEAVNGRQYIV